MRYLSRQSTSNIFIQSAPGGRVVRASAVPLLAFVPALALAGCSADIARFDSPSFALNDPPSAKRGIDTTRRLGSGAPIAGENAPGWNDSGPRTNAPLPRHDQSTGAQSHPRMAALPPPSGEGSNFNPSPAPTAPAARAPQAPRAAAPAQRTTKQVPTPTSGKTIEVEKGDTLYGLSKKHKVSIAALMEVNNLKQANLKPGQKLVLPQGAVALKPASKAPAAAAVAPSAPPASAVSPDAVAPTLADVAPAAPGPQAKLAPAAKAPATPPAPPSVAYDGQYVVKQGDSLFNVARAHRVPLAELERMNGITDARKVRPGTVLRVPTIDGSAPQPVAETPAPAASATTTAPKIINAPQAEAPAPTKVASLPGTANDAAPLPAETPKAQPVKAAAGPKFRWPAQGRVVTPFNKSDTGTPSDGIGIAVPQGTDIHAAESGTVAYAGNELKGYGNLVLVRHDNGFVTAYAHTESIAVKRGDTVKRGQVIAKAGKATDDAQPQVHFELRNGTVPVDPLPHLER